MTTQPMAPVDVAWLHIDGPVNLAQVTGIVLTRKPLDFTKVKAVFDARLRRYRRFRQRVVERGFPIATPCWEDMPDFVIEQKLHHFALPAPHDYAALVDLISDLAGTPLDHKRPLWHAHVVDGVDGGSALIIRFHHCMGDGTAMIGVIRHLFDTARAAAVVPAESLAGESAGAGRTEGSLAPALDAVAIAARKYGRRRVHLAYATFGRERVVQRDRVHRARPDQQRIGCVRRALVAVPAALHDEAQAVRAREVLGGHDVRGLLRRHREDAGRATPPVDPAGRLRARRLLADEVGVAQIAQGVSSDADPVALRKRLRFMGACARVHWKAGTQEGPRRGAPAPPMFKCSARHSRMVAPRKLVRPHVVHADRGVQARSIRPSGRETVRPSTSPPMTGIKDSTGRRP